jgi:hypothetical protein
MFLDISKAFSNETKAQAEVKFNILMLFGVRRHELRVLAPLSTFGKTETLNVT